MAKKRSKRLAVPKKPTAASASPRSPKPARCKTTSKGRPFAALDLANRLGGDYWPFVMLASRIWRLQELLDAPVLSEANAGIHIWTHSQVVAAQAAVGDVLRLPERSSGHTVVLTFPLDAGLRSITSVLDRVESLRSKKQRGGRKRGKDISDSIGSKFKRIIRAALPLEEQGETESFINESLATQFKMSDRHIKRIRNAHKREQQEAEILYEQHFGSQPK